MLTEKTRLLETQFSELWSKLKKLSDELHKIGVSTGFQAVIYDENENF